VPLVQVVLPAELAAPVNPVVLVNPAMMVLQAALVPLVMLVPLVVPAKLAALVPPETPATTAHLAAANTAHQLVWLQVIKRRRSTSQAIRRFRRQLGRLLNENKNIISFKKNILFAASLLTPSFFCIF